MTMNKIAGTRTVRELNKQELDSLNQARRRHSDAVGQCPDSDLWEDPDLAVTPVGWDRYQVDATWMLLQEERARLGLDWEPTTTSELTNDGKPLVHGMRVFTNNLDLGTVDLSRAQWQNARGGVKSLWFDVQLDTSYKGEPLDGRELQNAERVTTRYESQAA